MSLKGLGPLLFVVLIIIAGAIGISGLGELFNNYTDRAGQDSCQQTFGSEAEYVGKTSAFGGSAICRVGDEERLTDIEYENTTLIPGGPI